MSKKSLSTLKLSAAAAILTAGLGVSGITGEAAFDAPYYNITEDGGSFNGIRYHLADGKEVANAFFCDGTYTYFLQADGTPMKDRLTYHPDGKQVIYFDANGHECFDTFAHVKKSIAGDAVDDLCYFGTYGNLYVNVITYNKEGTAIYYANKYGVMERSGVFEVSSDAVNYSALANGCKYGYANSDGTVKGFYATYEEAAGQTDAGQSNGNHNADQQQGHWEKYATATYQGDGKQTSHQDWEGNSYKTYESDKNGGEYIYEEGTIYYDSNGEQYGYTKKNYRLKDDGTTYLSSVADSRRPETGDWSYQRTSYDENGEEIGTEVQEWSGSDLLKWESNADNKYGVSKTVITCRYENGKLVYSEQSNYYEPSSEYAATAFRIDEKTVNEYELDEKGNVKREVHREISHGKVVSEYYVDCTYITVAGQDVVSRKDNYRIKEDNTAEFYAYTLYTYGDDVDHVKSRNYDVSGVCSHEEESIYSYVNNRRIITRHLEYTISPIVPNNGELLPSSGYDSLYDNNKLVQKNYYGRGEDGNWTLDSYIQYNYNYDFPQNTSQTASFESERHCDGDGTLTAYTVEYWHYVQD